MSIQGEFDHRVMEMEAFSDTGIVSSRHGTPIPDGDNSRYGDLGVVFLEVKVHPNGPLAIEKVCSSLKGVFFN